MHTHIHAHIHIYILIQMHIYRSDTIQNLPRRCDRPSMSCGNCLYEAGKRLFSKMYLDFGRNRSFDDFVLYLYGYKIHDPINYTVFCDNHGQRTCGLARKYFFHYSTKVADSSVKTKTQKPVHIHRRLTSLLHRLTSNNMGILCLHCPTWRMEGIECHSSSSLNSAKDALEACNVAASYSNISNATQNHKYRRIRRNMF